MLWTYFALFIYLYLMDCSCHGGTNILMVNNYNNEGATQIPILVYNEGGIFRPQFISIYIYIPKS